MYSLFHYFEVKSTRSLLYTEIIIQVNANVKINLLRYHNCINNYNNINTSYKVNNK